MAHDFGRSAPCYALLRVACSEVANVGNRRQNSDSRHSGLSPLEAKIRRLREQAHEKDFRWFRARLSLRWLSSNNYDDPGALGLEAATRGTKRRSPLTR